MNKPLLTIAEFKAMYGVRRTKIYEMLQKGELRAVKIGRLTRIRAEDAQTWAEGLEAYKAKDPQS
jgi:excisionase family DNA binding protein